MDMPPISPDQPLTVTLSAQEWNIGDERGE